MSIVEVTDFLDEVIFFFCLKPANGAAECWQLTQLKQLVTEGEIITATSLEIVEIIMLNVRQILSKLSIPSGKQRCVVSSEGFSGGTESSEIMKVLKEVSNRLWCMTYK